MKKSELNLLIQRLLDLFNKLVKSEENKKGVNQNVN